MKISCNRYYFYRNLFNPSIKQIKIYKNNLEIILVKLVIIRKLIYDIIKNYYLTITIIVLKHMFQLPTTNKVIAKVINIAAIQRKAEVLINV